MAKKKTARRRTGKKREKRTLTAGVVSIQATYHNTIITFADPAGNVVCWASAGSQGFKGSRKQTPFAAQQAAGAASREARALGCTHVDVKVKGPGAGREAAIRGRSGRRYRGEVDQGRHPDSAQRVPATQENAGIRRTSWRDIEVPFAGLCRREGAKLFLKGDRCLSPKCAIDKRNFAPGAHGKTRRSRVQGYGLQLREKQKAKRAYGLLERQFPPVLRSRRTRTRRDRHVPAPASGAAPRQRRLPTGPWPPPGPRPDSSSGTDTSR